MTAQVEKKSRSMAVQMVILTIVAIVLIALAAKYIW
jgi:hypothetical protein